MNSSFAPFGPIVRNSLMTMLVAVVSAVLVMVGLRVREGVVVTVKVGVAVRVGVKVTVGVKVGVTPDCKLATPGVPKTLFIRDASWALNVVPAKVTQEKSESGTTPIRSMDG